MATNGRPSPGFANCGDAIADRDLFAKEQAAAQFRPFAAAPIELAVMNGSPKSKLYEQALVISAVQLKPPNT